MPVYRMEMGAPERTTLAQGATKLGDALSGLVQGPDPMAVGAAKKLANETRLIGSRADEQEMMNEFRTLLVDGLETARAEEDLLGGLLDVAPYAVGVSPDPMSNYGDFAPAIAGLQGPDMVTPEEMDYLRMGSGIAKSSNMNPIVKIDEGDRRVTYERTGPTAADLVKIAEGPRYRPQEGDPNALPATIKAKYLDQLGGISTATDTINNLWDLTKDDATLAQYGVTGRAVRGTGDVLSEINNVGNLLGISDLANALPKTFVDTIQRNAAGRTQMEILADAAAFQIASALYGQTGRGLSDQDFRRVRNSIQTQSRERLRESLATLADQIERERLLLGSALTEGIPGLMDAEFNVLQPLVAGGLNAPETGADAAVAEPTPDGGEITDLGVINP